MAVRYNMSGLVAPCAHEIFQDSYAPSESMQPDQNCEMICNIMFDMAVDGAGDPAMPFPGSLANLFQPGQSPSSRFMT